MSARSERDGGVSAIVTSSLFLKALVMAVVFALLGFVAPYALPDSEFVGVIVGMTWSLAMLILIVLAVVVAGTAIRRSLR